MKNQPHLNPEDDLNVLESEMAPMALIEHVQTESMQTPSLQSILPTRGQRPASHASVADLLLKPAADEQLSASSLLPMEVRPANPGEKPGLEIKHKSDLVNIDEWKLLESPRRLSESMLWQIQLDFYANQGIEAWNNSVPFFVTNSVFIAETYADLIVAFLRDYADNLNPDECVYIVEMASGTGRFGNYLLKELTRKMPQFAATRNLKWKVVMTDFTEKNIAFWESHEKFAPYIEAGVVDFAIYMPEDHRELDLRLSGEKLTRGKVKNPVIALANYFFDSIRHDIFWVESKEMSEVLLELRQDLTDKPKDTPVHIRDIRIIKHQKKLLSERYYDNPAWNKVLSHYRHNVKKGEIIFPTGGLQCMENLKHLSERGVVLISSDKSFATMEEMLKVNDHGYAVHDGAFSYMVNYDAMGRWFVNEGGHYFHTTGKALAVQTVCCIAVDEQEKTCDYENIRYLYEERIDRENRINSMNEGQAWLVKEVAIVGPSIDSLLSYIRLSHCDPKCFVHVAPRIIDRIEQLTFDQSRDLMELMEEMWRNYYHFAGEINLPFWMAQMYFNLAVYDTALGFFEKTAELFGEHEVLTFFMARCHQMMDHFDEAKRLYEKSIAMNPDFPESKKCLEEMLAARC